LRSNASDPIKGRLVTKLEVVTHGSLSAESPENFAVFQMNSIDLGQQFGAGPDTFGPRCNDCFESMPLIVPNNEFYSYAGLNNEGPGNGNNTVNFTVSDDVPWCVSKIEIRICAKPGPPQIHQIHVVQGPAEIENDTSIPFYPLTYNNTKLDPKGGEWIWFKGQNFLPSVDAVTYGPKGLGYVASNCTMYERGTLVRCLTEAGVGTQHNWKINANGESNALGSGCVSENNCTTSYTLPEILAISPSSGPTNGGIQIKVNARNIGEKDRSSAVRLFFGDQEVPAVKSLEKNTLIFFLPSLTGPTSTLTTKIFMEVESYKSQPAGSMGISVSLILVHFINRFTSHFFKFSTTKTTTNTPTTHFQHFHTTTLPHYHTTTLHNAEI
jgi:hypothetical protein